MLLAPTWLRVPAVLPLVLAPIVLGSAGETPPRVADAPLITAITPKAVLAGMTGFTLVVDGAGFTSAATVNWNGSPRPTTYVSATRLAAAIPLQDVQRAGSATITVVIANTLGGTSNAVTLPIQNPTPTVASLTPSSAMLLGEDFGLTVNGAGFVPSSVVRFNDGPRTTTYVSGTRLVARIPASDIGGAPGTAYINVVTPGPGGGASGGVALPIQLQTPFILGLAPARVPVGSSGLTLRVTGGSFIRSSTARVDGAPKPTTWVSPTQLDVQLAASDLARVATVPVTVTSNTIVAGSLTSTPARLDIASPAITLAPLPPIPTPLRLFEPVDVTFTGTGFTPQMTVTVNGSARAMTLVAANQARVTLQATDVDSLGPVGFRFENPLPTLGAATPTLWVQNPPPVATSLSPTIAAVGGAAFTLTVTGSRFVPGSVVHANGSPRATTVVSRTQLTATIPASDLTTGGDLPITVVTPVPGGGTSATLHLTRLYQKVTAKP